MTYNTYHYIKDMLAQHKEATQGWFSSMFTSMQEHYIKTALGIIAISYATLWSLLLWYQYQITYQCHWNQWNPTLHVPSTNQALYKEFKQQLINAIHEYYCDSANPTNFVEPLKKFSIAIDHEIALLQKLLFIHTIIHRAKLSRYFGINIDKTAYWEQRLQRVHTLKEAFKSWCAEYTLQTHHVHMTP
jgi:hypothetical protein